MIKAAIVDDEAAAIEEIKGYIARYEAEENEVVKVDFYCNAEKFLYNYKGGYDVVFMDIEMGGGLNGIQAARELRKADENVFLIFVTNMAQYALEGYEVDAFDYFVKPAKYGDLKMRLSRIRRIIKGRGEKTLAIPISGGIKTLSASDIYYIEVANHTLIYHAVDGVYSARNATMNALEKELGEYGFCRCNVCYLVNLAHCDKLQADTIRVGGDVLHISRPKRKEFVENFKRYLFKTGGGASK